MQRKHKGYWGNPWWVTLTLFIVKGSENTARRTKICGGVLWRWAGTQPSQMTSQSEHKPWTPWLQSFPLSILTSVTQTPWPNPSRSQRQENHDACSRVSFLFPPFPLFLPFGWKACAFHTLGQAPCSNKLLDSCSFLFVCVWAFNFVLFLTFFDLLILCFNIFLVSSWWIIFLKRQSFSV